MEERTSNQGESEVEVDLPDTFTSKIIDIIQNKQQQSPTEEYVEEESEPQSEVYQPPTKNNCKKSGKKYQITSTRGRKPKDQSTKLKSSKQDLLVEQNSLSSENEEHFYAPKRPIGRPKSNGTVSKQVSKDYKILKQYFQDFLTKMLTKMEDTTNKQIKLLEKRVDHLQNKGEGASQPKRKSVSFHEEYTANNKLLDEKRKKHRYIKTWAKLEYIDKIQRGTMTIKEVSKQLRIKDAVVQSWIANQQKLRAINNQKKVRKADKQSLDSQCLDVD